MGPKKLIANSARRDLSVCPLQIAGSYLKLKPGDLSHEVCREIDVPGSFWGDDADDKNVIFRAKVIEVELTHKFHGRGGKFPALRFEMVGSAKLLVDDTPLWIDSDQYSKYVHPDNLLIQAENKKKKEAEAEAAASGEVELIEQSAETDDADKSKFTGAGSRGSTVHTYFDKPVLMGVNKTVENRYRDGRGEIGGGDRRRRRDDDAHG